MSLFRQKNYILLFLFVLSFSCSVPPAQQQTQTSRAKIAPSKGQKDKQSLSTTTDSSNHQDQAQSADHREKIFDEVDENQDGLIDSHSINANGLSDVADGDIVRKPIERARGYSSEELPDSHLNRLPGDIRRYHFCGESDNSHIDDPEEKHTVHEIIMAIGKLNLKTCNRKAIESIKHLDLSDRKIKDIRPLSGFVGLARLSLDRNSIASQLYELSEMKQLQLLTLSDNQLTRISGLCSGKNTGLKKLNLANNQLVEIRGLASCHHLEALDIANNQVATIVDILDLPIQSFIFRPGNEGVATEVSKKFNFDRQACAQSSRAHKLLYDSSKNLDEDPLKCLLDNVIDGTEISVGEPVDWAVENTQGEE